MKKFFCVAVLCAVTSQWVWSVNLIANDAMGTSSFNSGLNWEGGMAPIPGYGYITQGYLLRTPSTVGSYTFGGDYLVVGGGDGGGANPFLTNGQVNNNGLINKTPANPVITVPYLILDAGYIRDGMGSTDAWALEGTIEVSPNGGGLACQSRFDVNSQILGSGPLYIADSGTSDSRRVININNSNNTYNGSIYLRGFAAGSCRLTFSPFSRMNFVPQYGGVCNSVTGTGTVAYNGDFYFDLWNASTNAGDSWLICNVSSQTFGSSFYIPNAQPMGSGIWWQECSGVMYSFDQNTGLLTCLGAPMAVIAPNGGERYPAGTPVEIKYSTAFAPGTSTVTIQYRYTLPYGQTGYGLIATRVPNTGTYLWTSPDLPFDSDTFMIDIYDDMWGFSDQSDAPFTVFHCLEYIPADINKDCYIDLNDLAMLAQDWLWCKDPYNSACTGQ
jgi:hypothetical protein